MDTIAYKDTNCPGDSFQGEEGEEHAAHLEDFFLPFFLIFFFISSEYTKTTIEEKVAKC